MLDDDFLVMQPIRPEKVVELGTGKILVSLLGRERRYMEGALFVDLFVAALLLALLSIYTDQLVFALSLLYICCC